jgi:NADH dehydrogenase [ubiquinone] 1 alpha subcomplex assembly factor 7
LLDALPIHQYQRLTTGWHERLVDVAPQPGGFCLVLAAVPIEHQGAIPEVLRDSPIGSVIELCPAADALVEHVTERCVSAGGAALFIDYGRAESLPGETLQGVRRHASHPVFESPGSADLSAHVDFARLRDVAADVGGAVWGPVSQGDLLRRLGIEARAARLKQAASPEQIVEIDQALERLVDPAKMGALFKAMAVLGGDATPAGFAAP